QTLASGGLDKTILLWDVATRQRLGELLQSHTSFVLSVAFSPDGQTLASGGLDETILLWDVATRQRLGEPLQGHAGSMSSVAFRPNGKTLASGSGYNTLILWDVNVESWQARACRMANRNLTRAEWQQYLGNVEPYRASCPGLPTEEEKPASAGKVMGAT